MNWVFIDALDEFDNAQVQLTTESGHPLPHEKV
jgi:hypothetical protein